MMYVNVVVGINGLPGDQDAVALAKVLGRGHDRFALAHVRLIEAVTSRGSSSAFDVAARDASSDLLERQRSALTPGADVVSIPATSVGAGLHEVAESHSADLIVVGSCHRSAVGRIFAGDDARSVLHHAPCAVAVAPAGYASGLGKTGKIAAAYDGSDESKVAMAHASLLAADLDAEVLTRTIVEPHVYGGGGWMSAVSALEDAESAVAAARERLGEVNGAELEVIVGPVREELAALSERVDVLVCGSRHQSAVKRVVLGSTSDYLARHCACPLLITPAVDEKTLTAWHNVRDAAAVAAV
jgi:nucleotide-binding universal stress UspA family protein